MRQGDSYPIYISDSGIDLTSVTKIEFIIGAYQKDYPGAVTYDSAEGKFSFPLSQAESLSMIGSQPCEAKIKYSNGEVEVVSIGTLLIDPSTSRTVI